MADRMTTMAPDYGSSSSSELEDEPPGTASLPSDLSAHEAIDESDTAHSSGSDQGSSDVKFGTVTNTYSTTPEQETPTIITMTARAYQLEMLEESLKQNIIVAMDTGSGKTQVAILRIKIELERNEKIAWFLAHTVALAEQQFEAIRAQTPGVQSKLIVGSDNVEAWSTQAVWDAVLFNTRIVVSTYQILFDAVSHAFVPLSSLCLIVVDEVHNARKENAVARLMREHYSPRKAKGLPVPQILGLTASPLVRSDLHELEELERTMDAVCKTPSKHRDELMAQVNRPQLVTVPYGDVANPEGADQTALNLARFKTAFQALEIARDPYILHLAANNTVRNQAKLVEAINTRRTYCQGQMKSFYNRASDMCETLGPWAADYYIHRVISAFLQDRGNASTTTNQPNDNLADRERRYLAEAFTSVNAQPLPETPAGLSPKVRALLNILESYQGNPVGIVFVRERATVAVLAHILSVHPQTRSRYRVGSMVGTSRMPARGRNFLDLTHKDYLLSLHAFRKGTTNLVVATSVLEEGIDVPACNLVVCFDEPKSLGSFIQRRGRARMSASQLYILVEDRSDSAARSWEDLEREMKRKYEDDMREIPDLEQIENSEVLDYPLLRDAETGAQLTIHDAKQHLEHFCATLSTRKFVDWSPFYVVHDLDGNPVDAREPGLRKATVHLPVSLAPELRCFESLYAWPSEANACKDAAFQAYAKLYEAGLVNRNLLPIRESDLVRDVEPRAGLATVREQFNPWPRVAQAWRDGAATSSRRLTVLSRETSVRAEFELVLPVPVPYMEPFDLHWDYSSSWRVQMDPDEVMSGVEGTVSSRADHTSALLAMAFGHRWRIQEKQYPVRLACLEGDLSLDGLGAQDISAELMSKAGSTYLIRDVANQNHPYFYLDWLPSKPAADLVGKPYQGFDEAPEDIPYVAVKSWPKKAGGFRPFHPNAAPVPSSKPYPRVLPASQLRVDSVPAVYAHAGMLIPAITHALEVHLVAQDLLESRLQQTGITDLSLVVMAVSTSGSRGPTDYERIEFLGDSILKFCTTINCSAKYLKFPEGYLSPLKDKIVANSRLFRAAVDFGLDRYICHKAFTLHKWRPTYVEDLLEHPPSSATDTRKLSTKILADVVEALIAASYLSGGIPRALACMSLFLPDFEWKSIEHGREVLYNKAPADEPLPVTMQPLESLIGYTFTKKSLLAEAMTHPSCTGPGIRASLDRLEFLGDAILDYIVVTRLFSYHAAAKLENSTLHLLRTALVNADILAFLVMESSIPLERVDVEDDPMELDSNSKSISDTLTLKKSQTSLPLWSFMRHASPDMGAIQRATSLRHAAMRQQIADALWGGKRGRDDDKRYPWSLLCRLQAQKFYSDVLEALLGAVWVDSGSIQACEAIVERLGIFPLMDRLLRDEVWLLHPKEELGQLAGRERVVYEVEAVVQRDDGGDDDGADGLLAGGDHYYGGDGTAERVLFACSVFVGGECVGTAQKGAYSREEARISAAEVACRVLKERMSEGESGDADI